MADQIQTLREIRAEATADAITGATDCKYPEGSMAQAVYWEQRKQDMFHISANFAAY